MALKSGLPQRGSAAPANPGPLMSRRKQLSTTHRLVLGPARQTPCRRPPVLPGGKNRTDRRESGGLRSPLFSRIFSRK